MQSLKAAKSHVYPKRKGKASAVKNDPYTGTLKTVIKLKKKKGKNSLKMTLQKNKSKHDSTATAGTEGGYKIMKEVWFNVKNYFQSNLSIDFFFRVDQAHPNKTKNRQSQVVRIASHIILTDLTWVTMVLGFSFIIFM